MIGFGAALAKIARHSIPSSFLLLAGILFFPSAGRDDSHITYWSAYALANFGEILNYNGDRIEQSSSLLQVVLLAAIHRLSGIDLVLAGRVFSVLCGIATLAAAHRLGERIRAGAGSVAALLSATSVCLLYWSFGGLESSLASLTIVVTILAWASYAHTGNRRSLTRATLATVLLALVRPEMPLVILCMLLGSAAFLGLRRGTASLDAASDDRLMLARLGMLTGVSAGVCVLIFGFRWVYFDSLFPQPVIAKSVGLSWLRSTNGLQYLLSGSHPSTVDVAAVNLLATSFAAIPIALCALGTLRAARDEVTSARVNPHVVLSLVFLVAYGSFIVLTGGDWMEGGRMISHLFPVAAAFVGYALMSCFKTSRARKTVLAVVVATQAFVLLDFAASRSSGMPLWTGARQYRQYALEQGATGYSYFDRTNRDHLRNIPVLDRLDRIVEQLLEGDREKVHIMAHQMGVMPYYLARKYFKRVLFFDVNGLTDRIATDAAAFASLPRSMFGVDGVMTHYARHRAELEADPDFVSPDVIVYQFYDDRKPSAVFEKLGYEIVYLQKGEVSTGSRHFPGGKILANQLIAVRRDLVPELAERLPREIDIRETGIVEPGSAW